MTRAWTVAVSVGLSISVMSAPAPVAAGLLGAPAPAQAQAAPPPKPIVIDGRETPEAIPDHWAWREAFYFLEMVKRRDLKSAIAQLTLTEPELVVVFAAAQGQAGRDADCARRIEAHRETLTAQGADAAAIAQAFADDTIDCRMRDLDIRDRVLKALSPEAQASLQAWVDAHRRSIRVTVPASEIELFKRPY
jgi:hypothetical protein